MIKDLLQYIILFVSTFVLLNYLPKHIGKGKLAKEPSESGQKAGDEAATTSKKKAEKKKKKRAAKAKLKAEAGEAVAEGSPSPPITSQEAQPSESRGEVVEDSDSDEDNLTPEEVLARLVKQGNTKAKIGFLSAKEKEKIAERQEAAKSPFQPGEIVEALYGTDTQYFPAKICAVHSDYTYTLEYDDGSKKTHVPRDRIRPKQGGRTGPTGAQAAAADEETSDNDSDFQRESETDWDFESTPIEEDVLAAGDTEWEMKPRRPASVPKDPVTGELMLTKKQRESKRKKERKKEKAELERELAQEGQLHARWGGIKQKWTEFTGGK